MRVELMTREGASADAIGVWYPWCPVRVVDEGGTRMGHTVVCDWKATYLKVRQAGRQGWG